MITCYKCGKVLVPYGMPEKRAFITKYLYQCPTCEYIICEEV